MSVWGFRLDIGEVLGVLGVVKLIREYIIYLKGYLSRERSLFFWNDLIVLIWKYDFMFCVVLERISYLFKVKGNLFIFERICRI